MLSKLKTLLLVVTLVVCAAVSSAQLPPPDPSPCYGNPNLRFTVSGNTTMVLNSLTDFQNPQSITFRINVESNNSNYRVYVAGVVTGISGSESTMIPLSSFTVSASNPGGSTTPAVTLNGNYQVVLEGTKGKNKEHDITLTRAAIPTFMQAPGTHTVLLHIRICQ